MTYSRQTRPFLTQREAATVSPGGERRRILTDEAIAISSEQQDAFILGEEPGGGWRWGSSTGRPASDSDPFTMARGTHGGLIPMRRWKRLKLLEEEEHKLKRLVANLHQNKVVLQDVVKRKL